MRLGPTRPRPLPGRAPNACARPSLSSLPTSPFCFPCLLALPVSSPPPGLASHIPTHTHACIHTVGCRNGALLFTQTMPLSSMPRPPTLAPLHVCTCMQLLQLTFCNVSNQCTSEQAGSAQPMCYAISLGCWPPPAVPRRRLGRGCCKSCHHCCCCCCRRCRPTPWEGAPPFPQCRRCRSASAALC